MEGTQTGAPAIPPRRLVPNIVMPPVPSRWDPCAEHPDNRYVALCKSCFTFLCSECTKQCPFAHSQCHIVQLDTNLLSTCEELTSVLSRKLKTTKQTMSSLHRALTKKRDRMIKKRNETAAEIERYFNALKEKLIRKLKHDETALLNHLNEKVCEQDELITESIDECSEVIDEMSDKKAVIANYGRFCLEQRGSSFVTILKNIVKTSDEIDICNKSRTQIEATRDNFLVIRFYVDSDAEKAALRTKVASVEVLNSQDNNPDSSNLETEGINEALQNVNTEQDDIEEEDSDDEHTDDLRVALPPTGHRLINASPTEQTQQSSLSPSLSSTVPIRDIHCLAAGSPRDSPVLEHSDSAAQPASPEEQCNDSQEHQTETDTKRPVPDDTHGEQYLSPNSSNSSSSTSSPLTILTGNPVREDDNRAAADGAQQDSQSYASNRDVGESAPEDDPPPPYPGFPRLQPRPNELPPPYPGPPPPPYTQNPEPASRSGRYRRRRLLGQSDQSRERALIAINPASQGMSPSTSGLKITKVFSVNEIHDKRSAGIFALAVVRSNCFVVVDRWNKKLKYFDPSGDSFGGLIFREEPWDVTLVTADLVAVTVPKLNTLYKIKVTEQSVITTSTVSTLRKYACVSFHKASEKFVCGQVPQFGEPVIDVIDINGGPILQTFRQDSESRDRCIFSYPRYVKVTDEGIVIVCDWNLKCLLLFQLDGSFVGRYKGTVDFPLNEPTGMAYDGEKKEIYVIDSKYSSLSAAIHTVSLGCECKDIIRWDNELRVAPAISPCRPGFAVGSKSGLVSLFTARQSRTAV